MVELGNNFLFLIIFVSADVLCFYVNNVIVDFTVLEWI